MTTQRYLRIAAPTAVMGVLFSGYMSGVRLLTNECALSEPCPLFLGHPACYTGFALFVALLVTTGVARLLKSSARWPAELNGALSLAGVLFAGRMTLEELTGGNVGFHFALGLPACAYGMVFFLAMLVASLLALKGQGAGSHPMAV